MPKSTKTLSGIQLVSTAGMSREEWLRWRRLGIGGSDAAAIVGMNPFVTPYMVWADKLGKVEDQEDNEAMRIGRDLEPYVVKRFQEATGKKCEKCNKIFQHPKHDFMLANIDRRIVGENAGLECKTTSTLSLKKFRNGEFPENYYIQCLHYMAVTGADRWYLAVLIMGREFKIFTIERDEEDIALLVAEEEKFWKGHVMPEIPPEPDGIERTTDTMGKVYADTSDGSVDLIGLDGLLDKYMELGELMDDLAKQREEIKQTLMREIGENTGGESSGYKVSWKPQERRTVDSKKLKAELPEIYEKYSKVSVSRPFTIKAKKIQEEE